MGFFDDYDQADSLLEVEYESAPQKKQTTREVTDTSRVGWEWSEEALKKMRKPKSKKRGPSSVERRQRQSNTLKEMGFRPSVKAVEASRKACSKAIMTPLGIFHSLTAAKNAGAGAHLQTKIKNYPDQYYYIKDAK